MKYNPIQSKLGMVDTTFSCLILILHLGVSADTDINLIQYATSCRC